MLLGLSQTMMTYRNRNCLSEDVRGCGERGGPAVHVRALALEETVNQRFQASGAGLRAGPKDL